MVDSKLQFYTNPMSRGRIVRWMLEEVKADYETAIVSFKEPLSEQFLKLNPMAKVPVLDTGSEVITEVAAICAWLAEQYPEAKLAPTVSERGQYYRWLFFAAGSLEQALAAQNLDFSPSGDQSSWLGYGDYARTMKTLLKRLEQSPYIASDRFTGADVYVGSQVNWGLQFGTIEERVEFIDYADRVTDRAAYDKANVIDNALMA